MGSFNIYIKYKLLIKREVEEISKFALSLDKHYITTRFPDSLPDLAPHEVYNKQEAETALNQAEKIIEFVKKEIFEE